jgi:CheY-like chemotaxis protein
MAHGGYSAPDSLRGAVILVVDGHDDHRTLLTATLRHCGAIVRDTASVDAGWATLRMLTPDALVLALRADEEQVLTFVQRIRSLPREQGGKIPVIGVGPMAEARTARMKGFDAFLEEPIDAWALCRTVAELTS